MVDWEDRFINRPRRTVFGIGVSAIVIVAGLALVGTAVFGVSNLLIQPARVVQKTLDADNMIYNYEWFRQQYQDVLAMDGKIAVQQEALDAVIDADERIRVASIVAGLKTKRQQMVADYNARGSMANRSIFTAGLPQQIQ